MSNMTLRKRISLVTLTALGAGLLSVTPAQAGNNPAAGATNVASVADVLNIATQSLLLTQMQLLLFLTQIDLKDC